MRAGRERHTRGNDGEAAVEAALGSTGDSALGGLLDGVLAVGARAIPAASSLSITLVQGEDFATPYATSEQAVLLDQAQYDDCAGPSVRAVATGEQIFSVEGHDGEAWDGFRAQAAANAVAGWLATPLRMGETTYGALNVYTRRPGPFSDVELDLAQALAGQVSNALALMDASTLNTQLAEAIVSRQVIGEAKGILMESEQCTRDEAFDILRRASQRTNRKLRDIAQEVVEAADRRARGEM